MKPTHTSFYHNPHNSGFLYQNFWDKRLLSLHSVITLWSMKLSKVFFSSITLKVALCENKAVSFVMMQQLLFFSGTAKGGRTFEKTTDLHLEQLSNKRNQHPYRSSTGSYKPIHPWAPAKFLCVHVVCVYHVWVYDIKRLSTASQTDRPELVNRCFMSSWGWGHGVSSQSLIKEKLPQLPVIAATWFMSLCQRTLWLLAKAKTYRFHSHLLI